LNELSKYKEAIESYNHAATVNPDGHEACYSRGNSWNNLGMHEEAIESYDLAIVIKPDKHEAWHNRGKSLSDLGRHEEAIESCRCAIAIKPDKHESWHGLGDSLFHLYRYEEAIKSFDTAVNINPKYHKAWCAKGNSLFALSRYKEAIENYQTGLSHINPLTHPEGWGLLHQAIGQTHYHKGQTDNDKFRLSPQVYYDKALAAFQEAESPLTGFLELHLELIQDFMKVYSALQEPEKANSYCEQGQELLKQLLNDKTPQQRRKLLPKFNRFRQLEVDILLQNHQPICALEAAELCKNLCLESLHNALQENIVSPTYQQIQTLLTPHNAIIYWHLSPSALTTFILLPDTTTPSTFCNYNLTQLQDWITQWDEINTVADTPDTTNPKKKNNNTPLAPEFAKLDWPQLQQILEISKIQQHLDQTPSITNLILIPHKDLHRLPLHQFFDQPVTFLPSLQIALNLQQKAPSTPTLTVDLIHPPQGSDLPNAEVEIATIRALIPLGRSLASSHTTKPKFLEFIGNVEKRGNPATAPQPCDQQGTIPSPSSQQILHFTGHSQHFARRPQESCLYIGLVSACLSGGASYTISTLWNVEDRASSPFFIYFYQQLAQNIPAPQALHNASQWLRNLTNDQLCQFYAQLQQHPKLSHQAEVLEKIRVIILTLQTLNPTNRPYQDPYYWAAFTISGIAPQAS
jgi:CHAT domain-containing protein/Tfp pilus assembly protein PilF